jgi:hypothetical protein
VATVDAVLVDLGAGPALGAAWQQVSILADQAPPPGKGPEFGKASPLGLVVVLLLAVATVFLIRSMTKRIRRLPASFDDPASETKPTDVEKPSRDSEDAGGGRA